MHFLSFRCQTGLLIGKLRFYLLYSTHLYDFVHCVHTLSSFNFVLIQFLSCHTSMVVKIVSVPPASSVFSYTILYNIVSPRSSVFLVVVFPSHHRCTYSFVGRACFLDHTVVVIVDSYDSYATLKYHIIPPLQYSFEQH